MTKPVLVPVANGSSSSNPARNTLRQIKLSILYRRRSLPHLERKIYHMAMGLICFALYGFLLTRSQAVMVLLTVGIPWLCLDLMRLYSPKLNAAALKYFGKVMRREELKGLSANSFYIIGLIVLAVAFPKPIALMSLLFLAIGDPIAAIIGSRYGKRALIGNKSLEGAVANYVVSAIAVLVLSLAYFQLSFSSSFFLSLAGGFISVVSELCPLPINDNLTIPVISSLLLSLIPGVSSL